MRDKATSRQLISLMRMEWRGSRFLFLIAMILYGINFLLAFFLPMYTIEYFLLMQVVIVSLGFSFFFGLYSWHHDHRSERATLSATLPVAERSLHRAKFVVFMGCALFFPAITYLLNSVSPVLPEAHVTLLFLALVIYPLTFQVSRMSSHLPGAIFLCIIVTTLFFGWLLFLLSHSALLLFPLSPVILLNRFVTRQAVNILAFLGVLLIVVAVFPFKRVLTSFLVLFLIIPGLFVALVLSAFWLQVTSFYENYPDPSSFSIRGVSGSSRNSLEASIGYNSIHKSSRKVAETGTVLLQINTGIMEIDKSTSLARLYYQPYSTWPTAVFSPDGNVLVYTSWSPLNLYFGSPVISPDHFLNPALWTWPFQKRFSSALWVWRRNGNSITPLADLLGWRCFWTADNRALFAVPPKFSQFNPSGNSVEDTSPPESVITSEKGLASEMIGYNYTTNQLFLQQVLKREYGPVWRFSPAQGSYEKTSLSSGNAHVFYVPQNGEDLFFSFHGERLDISGTANQTIIDGTIGAALGGCPGGELCSEYYPYVLCTFEDGAKNLRLHCRDSRQILWQRVCDYKYVTFSPSRKYMLWTEPVISDSRFEKGNSPFFSEQHGTGMRNFFHTGEPGFNQYSESYGALGGMNVRILDTETLKTVLLGPETMEITFYPVLRWSDNERYLAVIQPGVASISRGYSRELHLISLFDTETGEQLFYNFPERVYALAWYDNNTLVYSTAELEVFLLTVPTFELRQCDLQIVPMDL